MDSNLFVSDLQIALDSFQDSQLCRVSAMVWLGSHQVEKEGQKILGESGHLCPVDIYQQTINPLFEWSLLLR